MGDQYRVKVQKDHLEKLSNARPIQAISELIWNGLDAEANSIRVEIENSDMGMKAITVEDDGHGIPYEEAPELFQRLGGSWKGQKKKSKTKGRILHGKEGRGRFKALALGRVADWRIFFEENGVFFEYTITIILDDITKIEISDKEISNSKKAGVILRISELHRDFRSLEKEKALQELSEIFALYMSDYKEVKIFFENAKLDPTSLIEDREKYLLNSIVDKRTTYKVSMELIAWRSAAERSLFLCDEHNFPLHKIQPRFHTPGLNFSAYIRSTYFSKLQNENVIEIAEMNNDLQETFEEAQKLIKSYNSKRNVQKAQSEIEKWKEEEVYPYKNEPVSPVEEAERKVFEIVALNVNKHLPDFAESHRQSKAFQFRMLRQAIEKGPDELQKILIEVLNLPPRKQKELAKLLEEASFSNVISASKLVSDRLKFLDGLSHIIYDPDIKQHLKERSQLHRIIADNNTWIFGEEFSLSVDDKDLTNVLRKHKKIIESDIVIDRPVRRIDGSKGIIDLMLSRSIPRNHSNEREHLIIELKAPKVKIGDKEIQQIKKYAYAVADDERFCHLDTRWNFWVISNDLDKYAKIETRQKDKPRGQVIQTDNGITVWVKTWSEILEECNSRMKFLREKLDCSLDKEASLRYLQSTYEKYLVGIVEENASEEESQDSLVEANS